MKKPPLKTTENKTTAFLQDAETFFDICPCKCRKICSCTARLNETLVSYLNKRRGIEDNEEHSNPDYHTNDKNSHDDNDPTDPTYKPDEDGETEEDNFTRQRHPRKSLPNFALACDRYDISDRAGACLASALLLDLEMISAADLSNFRDRNTVRHERDHLRESL